MVTITVFYKSGRMLVFIVSGELTMEEFVSRANAVGGLIRRLEFMA